MSRSKHSGGSWYDDPSHKGSTKPNPTMEKATKENQKRRTDTINAQECRAMGMKYNASTGRCE